MERDFKGVWIPKEIWLAKDLGWIEKLFLTEITSLDGINGCWAGNNHFAEFFDLSKVRVSQIISSLVEKKYITTSYTYKNGSKEIDKRIIRTQYNILKESFNTPIKESLIPPNNFLYDPLKESFNTPIKESLKGVIQINNTKKNTIEEEECENFANFLPAPFEEKNIFLGAEKSEEEAATRSMFEHQKEVVPPPIEKEKKVAAKKEKVANVVVVIPSFEEFEAHGKAVFQRIETAYSVIWAEVLWNKYDTWVRDGWKIFSGRQILNWKSTLSNVITAKVVEINSKNGFQKNTNYASSSATSKSDAMSRIVQQTATLGDCCF